MSETKPAARAMRAAEAVELACRVGQLTGKPATAAELAPIISETAGLPALERCRESLGWALRYGTFGVAMDNPLHARALSKARAAFAEASEAQSNKDRRKGL